MRNLITSALILILLPATVMATAQSPDVLLFENKVYDLFANPLETLYKTKSDRPFFRISPGIVSTGNWRGYVAIWAIEDDVLYLRGIDSWVCREENPMSEDESCKRADLKDLFSGRLKVGRVRADWFSGELRIPDGKMLQYVHMGYGSVYERDIILKVDSGKVVGRSVVDNSKKEMPPELEFQRRELEKMKPKPNGAH